MFVHITTWWCAWNRMHANEHGRHRYTHTHLRKSSTNSSHNAFEQSADDEMKANALANKWCRSNLNSLVENFQSFFVWPSSFSIVAKHIRFFFDFCCVRHDTEYTFVTNTSPSPSSSPSTIHISMEKKWKNNGVSLMWYNIDSTPTTAYIYTHKIDRHRIVAEAAQQFSFAISLFIKSKWLHWDFCHSSVFVANG